MEIVILDGYTTNSGDLSWNPIASLGNLTVYDRTPNDLVVARSKGKQAALLNKAVMSADVLVQLPELKYIGLLSAGYNTVDIAAARKQGITVCNAAGYATDSVAQHVFSLLLGLTNQVALHHQSTTSGEWGENPDWTYRKAPMVGLAGKTMGIVGVGNIGTKTAEIARAFGMKALGYTRSPKEVPGIDFVSMETLFAQSDVISLHCPLTEENKEFVNAALLDKMKSTAYLINTGRGGLINEPDLYAALSDGQIAGAGLDVLSVEPPTEGNVLFGAKNCLITPHNAWGTRECRALLIDMVAANLKGFLEGNLINVVN